MTTRHETGTAHCLTLDIPELGITTIESRGDFTRVTWPTTMGPQVALRGLRRGMGVGPDIVSLTYSEKEASPLHPPRLGAIKSFDSSSSIAKLEAASIDDPTTGCEVVWQRAPGHGDRPEAVISAWNLSEVKLAKSIAGTTGDDVESLIGKFTQTIMHEIRQDDI